MNLLLPTDTYGWRCESETRVPSSRGSVKQYNQELYISSKIKILVSWNCSRSFNTRGRFDLDGYDVVTPVPYIRDIILVATCAYRNEFRENTRRLIKNIATASKNIPRPRLENANKIGAPRLIGRVFYFHIMCTFCVSKLLPVFVAKHIAATVTNSHECTFSVLGRIARNSGLFHNNDTGYCIEIRVQYTCIHTLVVSRGWLVVDYLWRVSAWM